MATMLAAVRSAESTRPQQEPDPEVPERARQRIKVLEMATLFTTGGRVEGSMLCPASSSTPSSSYW